MKKKFLLSAICVSMLCSLAACGNEEKKKNDGTIGITSEVNTEQSVDIPIDNTQVTEENANESAEGPGRRWIMEQDFSIPTVASPTDAMGAEVRDSEENTDLLVYPLALSDFEGYAYYRVDGKNEYSTLEDALADEECMEMVEPGEHLALIGFGVTTELGQYDHIPVMDWIDVMNPTASPVSYKECIENNWFYMENGFGDSNISGYDKSAIVDLGDDGDNEDGEDILAHYVKMFGAPTYFDCLITKDGQTHEERIDEFVENYKTDNTIDLYCVGWEFDEYVLVAYVTDGYYGYWALQVNGSFYYSRELWDALKMNNDLDYFKSKIN